MTLPKLNGDNKFWQFNVGHLLTLLAMIGAGIGVFINYDRRVNRLEFRDEAKETRLKTVEQTVVDLRPKLESTATNLEFLTNYIRSQPGNKHSP